MRRRAFTLVELLVVVAIIAILAAVLFPVFAQSREKSRTATCQSNLNQLVKALQMYTQDNDEMLCPAILNYPLPRRGVWDWLIQSNLKSAEVLMCPSWRCEAPSSGGPVLTYGMNYRLAQASTTTLNDAPPLLGTSIPYGMVRFPSGTIWITDNVLVLNASAMPIHSEDTDLWEVKIQSWNRNGITRFPQSPPGNYPEYRSDPWHPGPVHQGGTNVAFLDGHVKWFKTGQLVNPQRGSRDCLYDNAGNIQ